LFATKSARKQCYAVPKPRAGFGMKSNCESASMEKLSLVGGRASSLHFVPLKATLK
jgi:hypothetical protein